MSDGTPAKANKLLLEAVQNLNPGAALEQLTAGASPDTCAVTTDPSGTKKVEPALHYIVRLLYENADTQPNPRGYTDILSLLVKYGANIHSKCEVNFAVVGAKSAWTIPQIEIVTGLEFAKELKARSSEANTERRTRCMEDAIAVLQDAEDTFYAVSEKTVKVRDGAFSLWKSLLLSDRFSDVIIDANGSTIPAHKCILLAASEYFESLFRFHEAQGKAVIVAAHEPSIVKAVLTYTYLGTLDSNTLQERTSELIDIAQEWRLVNLQQECEPIFARRISIENVGETLELAHRLDSNRLKASCFNFIHRHAAQVLVRPEILRIPQEDPVLWAELVARMSEKPPDSPPKKRAKIA